MGIHGRRWLVLHSIVMLGSDENNFMSNRSGEDICRSWFQSTTLSLNFFCWTTTAQNVEGGSANVVFAINVSTG